jgi:hypothetical protein
MTLDVVALVLGAVATLVGALAAGLQASLARRSGRDALRRAGEGGLDDQLKHLSAAVTLASVLSERVVAEVRAQEVAAERAMENARNAEALGRLNEEQRKAIADVVRTEVAGESKRGFWKQVGVNVTFFIAGGLLSLAITLWVVPTYAAG